MAKEIIDLTAPASASSPRSSKSQKTPKWKTSASSKKPQIKNKKCAQCFKPSKPNLNHNTKDLSGQTYGISGGAFQAQTAAAAAVPIVVRPNTSLLQQELNILEPLIPKEPLQMGHFACNMPPPQFESYPSNFNSQLSAPCLYNKSTSSIVSYHSNYLVKKNITRPLTLNLFPDAKVNNRTSAFKGLEKKKRVNSNGSTIASNADEVDLELRLWFPMNN